jgi:preprotein translocase subunit SecG
MFTFLLIVHAIIAAGLVTVILMQRSEGGGLGMGGSPSGLMSARGAADFLTKATTVLASAFVLMSILLAVLATMSRAPSTIDPTLARRPAPAANGVPMAGEAPAADPVAAAAGAVSGGALRNGAAAITDTPVTNAPAAVRRDPAAPASDNGAR